MRIRRLVIAPMVSALALLAACGGGQGSGADGEEAPVKLSVVSAFDREDPLMKGFWLFEEKLKEEAPWVTLDYRGGTEVMASDQLGEGVSTGGIDMAATGATFHSQNVPMARAMVMSPLTAKEEREKGATDLLAEAHNKAGIHYVGRMAEGVPYKLYFREEVNPLKLSGKSIRTSPVYVGLLEALGAGPVAMPPGEIYGALERGVVDGYGWPALGVVASGWGDVTGYETSASFYQMDTVIIMNADKWSSLDEKTQEAVNKAILETEDELGDLYQELLEADAKEREGAGIKVIEMSEADTEEFVKKADEAGWSSVLSRAPEAQQLRDIYGN
ncbi:TRAP transporter substrate-binding protein DctP [Enemella sp. A6]|uniref:TRAP transporter substrate-binding protein DctP n=1 Tax=Enemella sp. A6 TaxID=3440152 RepID=UPI003EBAEC8D